MSFISKVAKSAVLTVFKDWLMLKEICRLDSALCNVEERKSFLGLFLNSSFALHGDSGSIFSLPVLNWLQLRSIAVRNMVVQELKQREQLTELLNKDCKLFNLLNSIVIDTFDQNGMPNLKKLFQFSPQLEIVVILYGSRVLLSDVFAMLPSSVLKVELIQCDLIVDENSFSILGKQCPKLRNLIIRTSYLSSAAGGFPLGLSNGFAEGCTQLELLNFSNSNMSFLNTVSELTLVHPFKALTRLHLSGQRHAPGANIVTIVTACPKLTLLNVSSNLLMTDVDVANIATVCEFLTDLDISSCPLLTDKSLEYVAFNSHKTLTRLIAGYTRFTDVGAMMLADKCQKLRTLNVSCCEKVTDEGVMKVLTLCLDLEEIVLWTCSVTDNCVRAVADGAGGMLRRFVTSIGGTSKVTSEGLKALRAARPALKHC